MSDNKIMLVVCGEAFSGKSTLSKVLADKYKAEILGRDRVYFLLEGPLAFKEAPDDPGDKFWSNDLWPVALEGVKNHLFAGRSVVFDDLCLYARQREELKKLAEKYGAKFVVVYMNIPRDILRSRKEKNKLTMERHDVPSALLQSDSEQFEVPTDIENPIMIYPLSESQDILKEVEERLI